MRGRPRRALVNAAIIGLDDRYLDRRRAEQIRQACIDEGLLDDDDLLDLDDWRLFTA